MPVCCCLRSRRPTQLLIHSLHKPILHLLHLQNTGLRCLPGCLSGMVSGLELPGRCYIFRCCSRAPPVPVGPRALWSHRMGKHVRFRLLRRAETCAFQCPVLLRGSQTLCRLADSRRCSHGSYNRTILLQAQTQSP